MLSSSAQIIKAGRAFLGIELGSTRIKAVLIGEEGHGPLAAGSHDWENRLENGYWTYSTQDILAGVQGAYAALCSNTRQLHGCEITSLAGMGVSAMMHGYLAFNKAGQLLVPFRTWRNTSTEKAADILSEELAFNIPQRWSIAHLYQAVLNQEAHLGEIGFLTTLAGYVHLLLSGERVLGVGDASGMFPINSATGNYDEKMLGKFAALIQSRGFGWQIKDILPKVLPAGQPAGHLTAQGAKLLDPSGRLLPGLPLCPPEGDAGTGMVATNAVAQGSGNVSAGTSVFAMVVLEKELAGVYKQVDMVSTPQGRPVAMVHCNNCTSDIDAWVRLMGQAAALFGANPPKHELYDTLYEAALQGEADCGGILSYNYYSGEQITNLDEGRPLLARLPNSNFSLANFMRNLLYASVATLKLGMDILTEKEGVKLGKLLGHGGLFKAPVVGQRFMAAALKVPVAVMQSAGEGGAWGIALLAAYMQNKAKGETLEEYLASKVFATQQSSVVAPIEEDVKGFEKYMQRYQQGLEIERAAVKNLV